MHLDVQYVYSRQRYVHNVSLGLLASLYDVESRQMYVYHISPRPVYVQYLYSRQIYVFCVKLA